MDFVIRAINAWRLHLKLNRYKAEQKKSLQESSNTSISKPRHFAYRRWKSGRFRRYFEKYKRKGTFESFLVKSALGFLAGVILTYTFFIFFIVGIDLSVDKATYFCTFLGVVFSLGLAFSRNVRCYVALLIPVFFSKRGRQALIAYAFVLAFTGPAKNILHNFGVLSDSLACGQEQLKRAVRQIVDMVKAPFLSLKETLTKLSKSLKKAVNGIKETIKKIKRVISSILIKKATSWLGHVVSFCNKELGTPFNRCMKTFDDAIDDCTASLGIMSFLCHIVHVVRPLCYSVKFLDYICMFRDFVSDVIVGTVKRKMTEFSLVVKTMFDVKIEFSYSFDFHTQSSKSFKSVASAIVKEINDRVRKTLSMFDVMSVIFSFFFVFIFLKVMYYRSKFLSSNKFDNRYITDHMIDIDFERLKKGQDTILPLEQREKKHFTWVGSVRLLTNEKRRILQSFLLLTIATLKIGSYMVIDFSLFWIMTLIREHGHRKLAKIRAPEMGVHVQGKGVLADLYMKMAEAFKPPDPNMAIDPVPCLPDPFPPDYPRYIQIGFLLLICWILAILEPYGLRLRNVVMSHYHPDRAKERSVWLYNHILRSRGNFLKFVRRQLRRKFRNDAAYDVTFMQELRARFTILRYVFGKGTESACLMCGKVDSTRDRLTRCATPGCVGKFCTECYASLQNICTICQHPIEYGDLSDVSEERYSSNTDSEQSDEERVGTSEDIEVGKVTKSRWETAATVVAETEEEWDAQEMEDSFDESDANVDIENIQKDLFLKESDKIKRKPSVIMETPQSEVGFEENNETNEEFQPDQASTRETVKPTKQPPTPGVKNKFKKVFHNFWKPKTKQQKTDVDSLELSDEQVFAKRSIDEPVPEIDWKTDTGSDEALNKGRRPLLMSLYKRRKRVKTTTTDESTQSSESDDEERKLETTDDKERPGDYYMKESTTGEEEEMSEGQKVLPEHSKERKFLKLPTGLTHIRKSRESRRKEVSDKDKSEGSDARTSSAERKTKPKHAKGIHFSNLVSKYKKRKEKLFKSPNEAENQESEDEESDILEKDNDRIHKTIQIQKEIILDDSKTIDGQLKSSSTKFARKAKQEKGDETKTLSEKIHKGYESEATDASDSPSEHKNYNEKTKGDKADTQGILYESSEKDTSEASEVPKRTKYKTRKELMEKDQRTNKNEPAKKTAGNRIKGKLTKLLRR